MSDANDPTAGATCNCGRPTREARSFCDDCGDSLTKALAEIPWLTDELEVTITKRKGIDYRRVGGGKGGSKEQPSPPEWGASEARTHLKAVLVLWTRFCLEERVRNQSPHQGVPEDDLKAISAWLMWRVDGLSLLDIGSEAVDEITGAVNKCMRLVDRPVDLTFYGPCQCGRDLYGRPKAAQVKCRDCNELYTTDELGEWMRSQIVGRLVTLREAAAFLGRLNMPVPHDTLKKWVTRGKVIPHGTVDGRNAFLFDDLLDQATTWASKRPA